MLLGKSISRALAVVVASVGVCAKADAFFPSFQTPSFLGLPNTTYQEWDGFTSALGVSPPTVISNPSGTALAFDSTAATDDVFLTGKHIYSFTGVIHPGITVSNFGYGDNWETTIWLQIETYGKEPDPNSVTVTPAGGAAVKPTQTTLLHQVLSEGGFGTFALDDYLFVFKVPGNASEYRFDLAASESSMSWMGARVDTQTVAVPEPGIAGLFAVGAGLILRRRRV